MNLAKSEEQKSKPKAIGQTKIPSRNRKKYWNLTECERDERIVEESLRSCRGKCKSLLKFKEKPLKLRERMNY